MAHHNAGRLAEAEAAYRRVLDQSAGQPDALHLLGVIALQVNKPAAAADLIGAAIRANPTSAVYHSNLGSALRRLGRLDEALAACRRALEIDASFLDGYHNLANLLLDKKLYAETADALRRLLAHRPALTEQRLMLGRALILDGRPAEAVEVLEELLHRAPGLADAYVNLGVALRKLGRDDEAIATYRRGLELSPGSAALLSNLGSALDQQGRGVEAVDCYRQAIARQPDFIDAHVNLSVALRDLNRLDEAVAAAREAIRLKPDSAEAHTNLGHARLLQGDLPEGFAEYEWRFRIPDFPSPSRSFPVPAWDGGPLDGLSLLVHDEQGVGDGINFLRYIPLLRARGARVIVECNTQLLRLFRSAPGIDTVVGRFSPLPAFDRHISLLSVPYRMGTRLDSVPADIPYLRAEPELLERWGDRLGQAGRVGNGPLRVGLVWAGSPGHRNDRNRSLALSALAPLGRVPGVRLYSVQKGPAAAQLATPVPGLDIFDLADGIEDFADTAAIVSHLDLVVTVDTSVAHLAGALGRPVWVMLPFAPDWRWLMEREDSPWYPTMRLFRQPAPGAWEPVVARVAEALAQRAAG
jgi:tetratricopeptide (TPR) repeat protein